jgi:N-acetylmuramoyl-L-alanine amidase
MEKHVVLEIAGHVQKLLSEQPGIQAHLTRQRVTAGAGLLSLSVFVGLPLPAGINSSVANSSFEIVLEIAGHVQKLLSEQPGIQAHLTRQEDFFIPLYPFRRQNQSPRDLSLRVPDQS